MKKYRSGIHYGEDRKSATLKASFRLLKTIHCGQKSIGIIWSKNFKDCKMKISTVY